MRKKKCTMSITTIIERYQSGDRFRGKCDSKIYQ